MVRILILMSAVDFLDAKTALYSARENAAVPANLSFGVTLQNEPDDEANALMSALGNVLFLCPETDAWAAMPELWQGESHVLMAHPAMRFTSGWDKALLSAWKACPQTDDHHNVITGYLPVREDPLDAVCPVGADAFTVDGDLTFRHGTPLKFTDGCERGPFLHEQFCFGPAAFFRAMAQETTDPKFLLAFALGWDFYALVKPAIRLVWDLPVAPVRIDPEHPLCEEFAQVFGVDFRRRTLSPQSRRGMVSEELNFRMKVPFAVRVQEKLRHWQQALAKGKRPQPLCVTLYTEGMPEETLRWLKRLAQLRHLPLLAYADPLLLRKITDFLPNVMEFKHRYMMELPVNAPEAVQPLSKAAILAKARDRELTHTHYVWLDADCLQFPVYGGTAFRWENLCTDRIVIAMVNGVPDPTMFIVPDGMVLTLSREMEARCLTFLNQRGDLPTEVELWQLIIREHPEWFHLQAMPVARQLFTRLTTDQDE